MQTHAIHRWIKTECGRAKYAELAQRQGMLAPLRLAWFVLIAGLRDWPLPNPDAAAAPADQSEEPGS